MSQNNGIAARTRPTGQVIEDIDKVKDVETEPSRGSVTRRDFHGGSEAALASGVCTAR